MSKHSIFTGQAFGPILGRRVPLRSSLGFTPTGALPQEGCSREGTRMIQEEGGYTPLPCPTGPDCYDIIDAATGTVVIKSIKGLIGGAVANHKAAGACLQYGYTYGQEGAPPPPVSPPPPAAPPPPPQTIPAPGPSGQTTVLPGPAAQYQQPCMRPQRISGLGFFGRSRFG